jgi:hypothetical protein
MAFSQVLLGVQFTMQAVVVVVFQTELAALAA